MEEIFAILREEADFAELMCAKTAGRPSPRPAAPKTKPHAPVRRRQVAEQKKPRRMGFEIFFAASLLLALMGAAYGNRDTLVMTFPQLADPITAYASVIDTIKAGLFSR